jgi:hypothetical protein
MSHSSSLFPSGYLAKVFTHLLRALPIFNEKFQGSTKYMFALYDICCDFNGVSSIISVPIKGALSEALWWIVCVSTLCINESHLHVYLLDMLIEVQCSCLVNECTISTINYTEMLLILPFCIIYGS